MNKLLLIIIVLLLPFTASAEFRIYTIDNKFNAVFPSSPKLTGQAGSKQNRHKSYHYTDEDSIIIYNATYQVGETNFNDNEVNYALNNYMKGQLKAVNGKLLSSRSNIINGNRSIIFSMSFHHQEVSGRKFSVLSYKNGHFYQWSVQDISGYSKLDAEDIFNAYVNHFSVK